MLILERRGASGHEMKGAASVGGPLVICFPALPGLPSVREDRRVQGDRQGQRAPLVQPFRARHLFPPGRVVRAVPPDLQNILQA